MFHINCRLPELFLYYSSIWCLDLAVFWCWRVLKDWLTFIVSCQVRVSVSVIEELAKKHTALYYGNITNEKPETGVLYWSVILFTLANRKIQKYWNVSCYGEKFDRNKNKAFLTLVYFEHMNKCKHVPALKEMSLENLTIRKSLWF